MKQQPVREEEEEEDTIEDVNEGPMHSHVTARSKHGNKNGHNPDLLDDEERRLRIRQEYHARRDAWADEARKVLPGRSILPRIEIKDARAKLPAPKYVHTVNHQHTRIACGACTVVLYLAPEIGVWSRFPESFMT